MTPNEIIRSNARAILPCVRGKSADERTQIYENLSLGPIGAGFVVLQAIVEHNKSHGRDLDTNARPVWHPVGDKRPRH